MKIPIEIEIEDSKNELILFLNELAKKHNLSYYFLSLIFSELYQEIERKKNIEVNEARNKLLEQNVEEKNNG